MHLSCLLPCALHELLLLFSNYSRPCEVRVVLGLQASVPRFGFWIGPMGGRGGEDDFFP